MKQSNENSIKIAEILKAIGHPSRIEILRLLYNSKHKKKSVTQIHEDLGLTQSETSRHLILLKNVSVLNCEKQGGNSYYYINDKNGFIHHLVSSFNRNL